MLLFILVFYIEKKVYFEKNNNFPDFVNEENGSHIFSTEWYIRFPITFKPPDRRVDLFSIFGLVVNVSV